MADRWWAVVVRGIAAILFGVLTLISPRTGLLAILFLWGAYAITDGVLSLIVAWRHARSGQSWGWLVFEGIVSFAAGALAFVWPGLTALALLVVIAAWAVLTGIAEIAAAVRLRQQIRGEWLLALSGVVSILFGVLLFVAPAVGAAVLAWVIGVYALVFGALLVALGMRLRSYREHPPQRTAERTQMPTAGVPASP